MRKTRSGRWSGVEWSGAERSGVGWSGAEWSEVKRSRGTNLSEDLTRTNYGPIGRDEGVKPLLSSEFLEKLSTVACLEPVFIFASWFRGEWSNM